jgi:hypothetical protein
LPGKRRRRLQVVPAVDRAPVRRAAREVTGVAEGVEEEEMVQVVDWGSPRVMNVTVAIKWVTGLVNADPSPRRSRQM